MENQFLITITVLIILTFFCGTKIDGIATYLENLDCLIVLLVLFTLAQLPFLYCCSFLFKEPSSAIAYNSCINVVAAIAPFITGFLKILLKFHTYKVTSQ